MKGAHGGTQESAGIAGFVHQVAGCFVQQKPRCIGMFAKGPSFEIFNNPNPCVGGARSQLALVFDRRKPRHKRN